MEDKYNKILENVLILADEQVVEICTKKTFYDTCLPRIPQNVLSRKNLCKLLAQSKKCHHFGLKIKEKRLHKKIRHYTMKIVNFNTILLHDKAKNEYYIVFYRSGLSFNTNIANFYFSGVTSTSNKRRKAINKKLVKMARKRLIKRQRDSSFKNYLRQSIKEHYYKYLDGRHNLISVHAIFTVDNTKKSKVFITRDIAKYSDIAKFIKMIDSFDPSFKWNVVKKMEDCLGKLNIPMNNVLVIAQINQEKRNLFIQWNKKLTRSLHRRNIKHPSTQLINTNILKLRLDHIRFNGTDGKCFMDIIEELVAKKAKGENIEKKLETQLNSCKTFIACLDAFETNQMTDTTKKPLLPGFKVPKTSSRQEPKSELFEDAGDTGGLEIDSPSLTIDDKFNGILSKIDTLQKRIRTHVDGDVQNLRQNEEENRAAEIKTLELEMGIEATPQQEVVKRDPFQKSKFCKPEVLRKDSKMLHQNLVMIEEYLKKDYHTNKQWIEGIWQDKSSEIEASTKEEVKEASAPNVVEIQKQTDNPEPEIIVRPPSDQNIKTPGVAKALEVKAPVVTKAPGAKALGVKVPEVKAPEVKALGVKAPEVRAPEVRAPEVKAPGVKASKVKESGVKASGVTKAPRVTKALEVTTTPKGLTVKQLTSFEKLIQSHLENSDPEFEKLFKVLKIKKNSESFKKFVKHLKKNYLEKGIETDAASETSEASERSLSEVSNCSSSETNSLKSIFTGKNTKLRSGSKQRHHKKLESKAAVEIATAPPTTKPSEPTVIKLENFIGQILKITKNYFTNGSGENTKQVLEKLMIPVATTQLPSGSETSKSVDNLTTKPKTPAIITIKKFTEMDESKSEMSTNTVNSFVRRAKMTESAAQTDRNRKRRLIAKLTQTEMNASKEEASVAMETQTDISIHKHAQIKFSGMSMQLSKNVTITNVRKNVINVRNICEETSEAVKRLLEREAVYNEDDPILRHSTSRDLSKGKHKAEILGQIKNTLENVIDRFKKSTMLISRASNFADMPQNMKKVMVPTELPVVQKEIILKQNEDTPASTKDDKSSNLTMSLKLLKNLSEVTKTIRKNPREAARKLYGIRNELMHYRKNNLFDAETSKVSSQLYFPKTSSTLTSKQSRSCQQQDPLFPKDVPLNVYGYPVSNSDLKADLNELNRIFTPKTRSICNTELSILKHRDRHADHIASHSNTKRPTSSKTFRTKSAQMKSHRCQMYIAKTYKRSYANSLSATACAPFNVPQIQTAIENPLVPKIVRPVRWKHPLPESPQLSNLSLEDVKPFNSEYPRKDYVTPSSHSYLERLLASPEKQEPLIKCSDNDCVKCSEKASQPEVSVCEKSPKETTDFIVKKGKAHFKTETPKNIQPQVAPQAPASVKFDFGKFMLDPDGKNLNVPQVNYTVWPVNILQNKTPESPKSAPANKRLHEVKSNQNKVQKSIQQAITQNQEKFQAMQRILALSKPQERKMAHPSSSKNSSAPPKIKSTHPKKFSKNSNDAGTSKSKSFSSSQNPTHFPQQSHSIQTAVSTYKTVKQVQPHPKLKQLQQHQIPLKPKLINIPVTSKPPTGAEIITAENFNKKYSEVSLSSLKTITTITKEEKPSKTLTQNLKNVKRSQEDIQKYIALVEQKFLKTFSLNEQEKEGAYKNLVDEIQGMLNVLNSKDKIDKKMKIKKSVEKLTKETENVNIPATIEGVQQKKDKPAVQTANATSSVKKATKTESPTSVGKIIKYAKTLESAERSLKDFQTNCVENNKISEAAAEKLLNWKSTKSTHEDLSKISQYTLSEKERMIEEKLVDFPPSSATETNNQTSSVVVIKTPISMATMDKQTSESNAMVIAKKKNSDYSQPTWLSTTINSSDSLIVEMDDTINNSNSISMNSSSKFKSNLHLHPNKSHARSHRDKLESPYGTDTSLIPISNDVDGNSYLTITEFSETGSSGSDIKITPLVEFSIEMYLCDHQHYSYRCQPPVTSLIPHIYYQIQYTEKPKPITQTYKQKYSSSKIECYERTTTDQYPISSSLNFTSLISDDSFNIEQEFIKSYSDKLFSESINTILSKNSDFSLKNVLGSNSSNNEHLVRKTSSNFYEYIDLLSNISRIFIEPEVTQFYQPKFVSYCSIPARETKTYYMTIIFYRVEFNYSVFNPSHCNLLNLSTSNLSARLSSTTAKNTSSVPLSHNSSSYLSIAQNTVSEFSDLTATQFSNTSVSTADLFSEAPRVLPALSRKLSQKSVDQSSLNTETFYSVKSSITKFDSLNENVEIQTATLENENDNVNILIQNVGAPNIKEPNVETPKGGIEAEPNETTKDKDEAFEPLKVNTPAVVTKKPSLEELYLEEISNVSQNSSTCSNSLSFEINFNDDETPDLEVNDRLVETLEAVTLKNDFKRLSNKLAQQSNELGQLLVSNQYQPGKLPKLVSVRNRFFSQPCVDKFGGSYDCNYDLRLTISPKFLATNFPCPTGMQIVQLLKHRIGSMKIEMNQVKSARGSSRNISFKKPKTRNAVSHKGMSLQRVQNMQNMRAMQSMQKSQKSESFGRGKFCLIQVDDKEMFVESYKMILIFLYVSLFSFIFTCMTLNYKCE